MSDKLILQTSNTKAIELISATSSNFLKKFEEVRKIYPNSNAEISLSKNIAKIKLSIPDAKSYSHNGFTISTPTEEASEAEVVVLGGNELDTLRQVFKQESQERLLNAHRNEEDTSNTQGVIQSNPALIQNHHALVLGGQHGANEVSISENDLKLAALDIDPSYGEDNHTSIVFGRSATKKVAFYVNREMSDDATESKIAELISSNIGIFESSLDRQLYLSRFMDVNLAKKLHEDMLIQFPILNGTSTVLPRPDIVNLNNIAHNFLSHTISTNPIETQSFFASVANTFENSNSFGAQIIRTMSAFLSQDESQTTSGKKSLLFPSMINFETRLPFRIIHAQSQKEIDNLKSKSDSRDADGFYHSQYNFIAFKDKDVMVHEVTHGLLNILFENNSIPYPNNVENKEKFAKVIEAIKKNAINLIASGKSMFDESLKVGDYSFDNQITIIKATQFSSPILQYALENYLGIKSEADLQRAVSQITSHHNITPNQLKIIGIILGMSEVYGIDNIPAEIPAIYAHLSIDESLEPELSQVFAPFLEFWNETVQPIIDKKLEQTHSHCDVYNDQNNQVCLVDPTIKDLDYCVPNLECL